MKTASVTEFRKNIKEHLEEIEHDQDFLILSRPKGKAFVLLPMELYESLQETAHLLSTTANAKRLMKGIRQAKQGKAVLRTLKLG